jgi:hypothetical protein
MCSIRLTTRPDGVKPTRPTRRADQRRPAAAAFARETSFAEMGVQHQHTKLLNASAREVLRPLGIVQKGRSRTWLDDRGWWLGVIEFQPSSWSRGSYLNVGVNWLWNPKEDLSFDVGGRVDLPGGKEYFRYRDEAQFAPLARKLALIAATQVHRYRTRFPTIESAATTLRQATDLLGSLDAAIALGLEGDEYEARTMFARYIDWFESDDDLECRTEDDEALYDRARFLSELVPDRPRFAEQIRRDVGEARAQLKLGTDVALPF